MKRFALILCFLLSCLGVLSSCKVPDAPRSAMARPVERPTVETVSYNTESWGKIDIIHGTGGVEQGVIVWVHGGAWISGSRDFSEIPFYVTALLAKGWSIASVGYPSALSSSAVQMVQSVQQAVSFVRENAATLGLNDRAIVLGGHSAGGWLAAMAAYNGGLTYGVDGVIAFAAPLDLVALSRNTKPLYGFTLASLTNVLLDCAVLDPKARDACGRELLSGWSVTSVIESDGPGVYLGYGDLDEVVPSRGTSGVVRRFEETLGQRRVWVDVAEGSGHAVEGVNVKYLALFLELVAQGTL
jgi:acetyl esterase/lipase